MRNGWEQRGNRSWVALLVTGAFIMMSLVWLQAVVLAVGPESLTQLDRADRDAEVRVLSRAPVGSRIGVSVDDLGSGRGGDGVDEGAYVEEVWEDSPAERAGFAEGDVIVDFDAERVRGARQLSRLVQETPAGREVAVTVVRAGSRQTLSVTPEANRSWFDGERLARQWRRSVPSPPPFFDGWRDESARRPQLGVTVTPLTSQLAEYFGVEDGLLVSSVETGSPAESAGLQAGDVITGFNGEPVDDVRALQRRFSELRETGHRTFTVEVSRDRRPLTLDGRVEGRRSPRGRSQAI